MDKPPVPPKPQWLTGRPIPKDLVKLKEELDELSDSISELSSEGSSLDDGGASLAHSPRHLHIHHTNMLSRSVSMDADLVGSVHGSLAVRRRVRPAPLLRMSPSTGSPTGSPMATPGLGSMAGGEVTPMSPRSLGVIRSISIDEGLSLCHHSVLHLKVTY